MNELLKKLAHELEEAGEHEEAEEVKSMLPKVEDKNKAKLHILSLLKTLFTNPVPELKQQLIEAIGDFGDGPPFAFAAKDEKSEEKLASAKKIAGERIFEDDFNISEYPVPNQVVIDTYLKDDTWGVGKYIKQLREEAPHLIGSMYLDDVIQHYLPNNNAEKLASLADKLDAMGLTKEADLIDATLQKMAKDVEFKKEDSKTEQSKRYDSKHNNEQTFKAPKSEKPKDVELKNKTLSTRHCPDHVGVMLHRVGEGIYRCELDGKTYNYELEYGSVSAQTDMTSNTPLPSRLFDPKEEVLNRVN